jgi:hypothetical protein
MKLYKTRCRTRADAVNTPQTKPQKTKQCCVCGTFIVACQHKTTTQTTIKLNAYHYNNITNENKQSTNRHAIPAPRAASAAAAGFAGKQNFFVGCLFANQS